MKRLAEFLECHDPVVEVRVSEVAGSAPRETGALMLVSKDAIWGTIGGGHLEFMAIDEARTVLQKEGPEAHMDVPLGPGTGQCCGGRVKVALRRVDEALRQDLILESHLEEANRPSVLIFGAGHVGRALVRALAPLPVQAVLIDERHGELAKAGTGFETRATPLPEAEILAAPKGSAYVVVTHDHALDFLIAEQALSRVDAAYVGMIGSKSKRAQFDAHCRRAGSDVALDMLTCPMADGLSGSKRPEVIAAIVASEIVQALWPENARVSQGVRDLAP